MTEKEKLEEDLKQQKYISEYWQTRYSDVCKGIGFTWKEEPQPTKERKFIQIAATDENLMALSDDGVLWAWETPGVWRKFKSLPTKDEVP
jgi:hypothetical protein